MERKIFLTSLLLLILCLGIGIVFVTSSRLREDEIEERVYFDQVVLGNGTGRMVGYFGRVIKLDEKFWFDHGRFVGYFFYVRVLPQVNIHHLALRASAYGYKTELVIEPYYDPVPRVVIKHRILLYPNNVSIWFRITVLENGYLGVGVRSDYYLRDDWMRTVFRRMLRDIHLPLNTISQFELEVNWLLTID